METELAFPFGLVMYLLMKNTYVNSHYQVSVFAKQTAMLFFLKNVLKTIK